MGLLAGGGALSGILSLVSGVVGAIGAVQSARAQAESDRYQAQVADNNKKIAQQSATWAEQAGVAAEVAKGQQTRAAVGEAKAAFAANGVDAESGSAMEVIGAASSLGLVDSMTIRSNASREAYGYRTQGANFGSQATLLRMSADNALKAGALNAFSSLLGGATSFASGMSKVGLGVNSSGGGGFSFGASGAVV